MLHRAEGLVHQIALFGDHFAHLVDRLRHGRFTRTHRSGLSGHLQIFEDRLKLLKHGLGLVARTALREFRNGVQHLLQLPAFDRLRIRHGIADDRHVGYRPLFGHQRVHVPVEGLLQFRHQACDFAFARPWLSASAKAFCASRRSRSASERSPFSIRSATDQRRSKMPVRSASRRASVRRQ